MSRPKVFCKRCIIKNLQNSRKKSVSESLFNKAADLQPATLLKERLWHMCFPVNFAKFLRTPSLTEHLLWLLLALAINGPKHMKALVFSISNRYWELALLISSL